MSKNKPRPQPSKADAADREAQSTAGVEGAENGSNADRVLALEGELAQARRRVADLERELSQAESARPLWKPREFYTAYYATTGFMLGMLGATTSLVFNIVGSLIWSTLSGQSQHPLRLVQVYLTFPLGASALDIDNGLTLAIGCCLYLGAGSLYGVAFQLLLARFTAGCGLKKRLLFGCGFAVVLWLVNFYGILSWLQPLLFGGRWIVELVPWWIAGLTHLVFGATMALIYPWGEYVPYRFDQARTS